MRSMRRSYQQVDDLAALEGWLAEAAVGRLATVDENGFPVVKPLNFVYSGSKIFFHSAPEGEKLDDIRRNNRVGFEIDKVFAITPPVSHGCQTHCFYQSIVIRGRARILSADADRHLKEHALRLLVEKHAPAFAQTPLKQIDETEVIEITIESITGKEDFGQRWSTERKLAIARMLLDRDGDRAAETISKMGLTVDQVVGGNEV